jgi:hypothetical protein
MVRLVHEFGPMVVASSGDVYVARAYAAQNAKSSWDGWLVFFPLSGGRALPTDRETTQPNIEAVAYWAGGLTPIYLEGALGRAIALLPEAQLERRAQAAAREEAITRAESEAYAAAAEQARVLADAAKERRDDALRTKATIEKLNARR